MLLAGKFKISLEEKIRREEVRQALSPGILLEFIQDDYHEDDETPPGFMVVGDVIKLIRIIDTKPLIRSGTREQVGTYNIWEIETHWGLEEKSEYYLSAMTKIKM